MTLVERDQRSVTYRSCKVFFVLGYCLEQEVCSLSFKELPVGKS